MQNKPQKERKLWEKPSAAFELEYAKTAVSMADVVSLLDTQLFCDVLLKS